MQSLHKLNCKHYNADDPKLTDKEINALIKKVDWKFNNNQQAITKKYKFKNYIETIAFVNAVASIVNQQDHHPTITITYNTCFIEFTTHSIAHISMNDFICADKINNIEPHE